jgi:hypothetical protein
MSAAPETGFLVLADLTGYTAYLTGSELEHAPAIAGDLLETVAGRLDPPFRLAKFEGDAAFLFVEDGRADGSLLLDAIEACYIAFRRRLRSIDAASSCDCNSCLLAPRLGLKLFVHHGSYVHTRIAGHDELAGPDVIVVHRLLKGTAAAAERGSGFALLTHDAAEALALEPERLGLSSTEEPLDDLGRVTVHVLGLEASWLAEQDRRRLEVPAGAGLIELESSVTASAAVVWAHLTTPALRARWEGPLVVSEAPVGGWRGVGTVAQCVSGRLASLEEIVDWQPYEHVGWRRTLPDVGRVAVTADLDEVDAVTRLRMRWAPLGGEAVDASGIAQARRHQAAALGRLARLVARPVPDPAVDASRPPTAASPT